MSQVPPTSAASTNFETILTAALQAYNKQTKKDIASHPLATQLRSCDSPSAIITVLRTQVQTFDQSQSADEKLTKWLDPTVNVLYAFTATLSNGVGLIFPASNAIFSGIGVLLQAVMDVRASQDALVDLFGRVEYFFKRLEAYIEVRPTTAMTDIIVKIMVEVLSILGIVTKEIGQGRMKKYFKKLIGRKDIEDALRRLDQLTQEEARMAAIEVLKVTRGIYDKVEGVDERVQNVDTKVEVIEDQVRSVDGRVGSVIKGVMETRVAIQQVSFHVNDLNRNELRKDLRQWIAPPDPSVNFNTASDAHHEGTAIWCTEGKTLADWKTSGCLLWIHGKPGSGKSIISSVIIRDIKSMSNAGSMFLAYFYFDFKDTAKQDSRALLSSLLVQLSNQSDQFCDVLRGLYSDHQDGSQQPNTASLRQCLRGMLTVAGPGSVYLVMDALDECPNDSGIPSSREMVLQTVKELVNLHQPNLRLCVTSRPEYDIRTALEPLATQQLSLHEESGQQQDINNYVTSLVHSDENMKRWRDSDKDMVVEKLTQKADGMFRWVFCQLEVLRHCFPTNLRHVLEELPKTLDDTYKRILKEINNSNWGHAYRLLQCLAVASRPLQVEELAEVLAFDLSTTGIPKLNEDWRWENQEQAVLSACSSLVSVITNNGSRIVQFSHFSVKEFLTSHRLASCMDVSQFYIPIEPSHMILAQACIGVLLCLDDRTDEDSVRKIPLYRYAAEYWVGHAQFGNVESEIKDAMYYLFDVEKPHLSAWVRLERPYDLLTVSRDQGPRDIPPAAAPLYFAAWKGFRGLVERLIAKNSQQVHHLGGLYGAPLSASVDGGHIEVAQLLFTHGANINARSADNWTPLHIASLEGHLEIVKWLLDKGADASSREKYGMTPLHFAASGGHLEVCQTLFERGEAEVNSWAYNGYTPLLCATESGNPDVLQLLLDHNADMHMTDIKGNTPLHLATEDGDLKIAQILLEHKVDVNSRNDDGSTPFLRALETGNLDVAWLLLDHNADVHMHDNRGNTPLQRAACSGLLEVSRKILDRSASAEVNSCNYHGSTPLLLASEEGHADVVRLLLDFNADMYARDGDGDTALHCAALRGRLEVSQILLELNLDVNSRNNSESTPLHRVLEGGREGNPDVARLLLDYGADVQARDLSGRTAFELARDRGQHEIVGLLPQHASE